VPVEKGPLDTKGKMNIDLEGWARRVTHEGPAALLRELEQFGLLDLLRWRLRLLAVDWSQPNYILAPQLGVSTSRISQLRQLAGAAPLRPGRGPGSVTWPKTVDWTKHDREIAEQVGRTRQAVNLMRKRLKAPLAAPHKGGKRYDWSGIDWSLPASEIARGLGCTRSSVYSQQQKRGMRSDGFPSSWPVSRAVCRRQQKRRLRWSGGGS